MKLFIIALVTSIVEVVAKLPPLLIGILHSQTGTLATSEKGVIDATVFAIDEINALGYLGREIVYILEDGKSDSAVFANKSIKLITQDKVVTVFGCWASAARKTIKPIYEEYDSLLMYPVQYEGLEMSPNIFYLGAAPNQQLIPAIKWLSETIKSKTYFLVGSDYIFPHAANAIMKDYIQSIGGTIVGEQYMLLGSTNAGPIVYNIVRSNPDVILNTINGDSNKAFFTALSAAGITQTMIPTMSFSISEAELTGLNNKDVLGGYASWNYFMFPIKLNANIVFREKFKSQYGFQDLISDPMESAYNGVHMWAQAMNNTRNDSTSEIVRCLKNQTFNAPEGPVRIDPATHHTLKASRIGQINSLSQFDIVFESSTPITPEPYPLSRTRSEWDQFEIDLYVGWGNKWAASIETNYQDCSWKNGNFIQVVSLCDAKTLTRSVTYERKLGTSPAEECTYFPTTTPKSQEIDCTYVPLESSLGQFALALCVIGTFLSVLLLLTTCYFFLKKSVVIRRSQPIFLVFSLTGTVLLNLCIATFIGPNTSLNCELRPWCFNIAATLMLAPIFAKLRRVQKVFDAGMKRILVTDFQVVLQVLALIIIDIIILILWTTLDRPAETFIATEYKSVLDPVQNSFCNTSIESTFEIIILVYKILLLAASTNLAKTTWNIPAEFSEAKQFAIAIYMILLSGTIAYFISSTIAFSNPAGAMILRVIGIFFAATTTVMVVMLPKIRLIFNGGDVVKIVNGEDSKLSSSLKDTTMKPVGRYSTNQHPDKPDKSVSYPAGQPLRSSEIRINPDPNLSGPDLKSVRSSTNPNTDLSVSYKAGQRSSDIRNSPSYPDPNLSGPQRSSGKETTMKPVRYSTNPNTDLSVSYTPSHHIDRIHLTENLSGTMRD